MTTLVNIARRADTLFDIENYLAREQVGDGGTTAATAGARGRWK